jgi:hypothetical protein
MKLLARTLAAALALSCAGLAQAAPPSAEYVAMSSSFAAGPGLPPYAPDAPPRCALSLANYARQLAALRGLRLNDVSCSAATTRALLEPWN